MSDERLIELEVKLGFAEDMLDALNRTVFRQQQQIELLQRQLQAMCDQLAAAPAGEPRNLRDEIPPHY